MGLTEQESSWLKTIKLTHDTWCNCGLPVHHFLRICDPQFTPTPPEECTTGGGFPDGAVGVSDEDMAGVAVTFDIGLEEEATAVATG